MVLCGVFLSRSTRRLTSNGSGFKASQKTGPWLKVSSDRLGEAANRTCDSWFTNNFHLILMCMSNIAVKDHLYKKLCDFM